MKLNIPIAGTEIRVRIPVIDDFADANKMSTKARSDFATAKKKLTLSRESAKEALEELGRTKLAVYDNSMRSLVLQLNRIKNVELRGIQANDKVPCDIVSVIELKTVDFKTIDGLKAVVAGGGAGAVSGAIAFGAVGAFATASTGTAIASLSGAAATNATLAFLGGGSLAAGGLGVAGGTAVLGGLVAIPVLVVGGLVLNAKAKEALENAKANRAKANRFVKECDAAVSALNVIAERTKQMMTVLGKLDEKLRPMIAETTRVVDKHAKGSIVKQAYYFGKRIVARIIIGIGIGVPKWLTMEANASYRQFTREEKEALMLAIALGHTIKNVLDTNLLDEKGLVTTYSGEILEASQRMIAELAGKTK